MNNGELYDWVFHYNHYTQKWNAVRRDYFNDLFSNRNSKKILSSSSIDTLISLITKTAGKASAINKLLKNQIKHVIVH